MKKRNKAMRFMAAGLASVMMLSSLTACQKTDNDEDTSKDVDKETGSEESANGEESIVLTYGLSSGYWTLSDGIHTDDVPLFKALYEATGVELDIIAMDNEKMNLLATGGDLPDIMNITSVDIIPNLVETGQLVNMSDYLDEYGQNIKNSIPDALAASENAFGGVYYLPRAVNYIKEVPSVNGFVGFKLRYDVYEAIGSPELATEDDWLNVLKQMQDYQREQTGDDSIYGIGAWSDVWPYTIAYAFSHGYRNGEAETYYNMRTGEFESTYLTEDGIFWEGMEWWRKAYQMGIVDPDSFTQKEEQHDEKVTSGKYLCTTAFGEADTSISGENAIYTYMPGMGYISGVYGAPTPFGSGLTTAAAISSNCEYPERAMQVWDWFDSTEGRRTVYNGEKGVDWDYVDGEPQFIGEMAEAVANDTLSQYKENRNILSSTPYSSGNLLCDDGYYANIVTNESYLASKASTAQKHFAQNYDESFTYPGQVYAKWVEEGIIDTDLTDDITKKYSFMESLNSDLKPLVTDADNYMNTMIPNLMMAETEEEFNSVKQEAIDYLINSIGFDAVWEEMQDLAEKSAEKCAEVYGE